MNGRFEIMHRLIMKRVTGQFIPKGLVIDHINHNSLDNRRANLRQVTNSENCKNRTNGRGGLTFRGDKFDKPWRVRICTEEYKRKHIGVYTTKEEAETALQEAIYAYANS